MSEDIEALRQQLTEAEKAAEVSRIRGWVNQIAKPCLGAGRMARVRVRARLHGDPAGRGVPDVGQLWLPERRTPAMAAAQCEYLARVWPGIRAEVTREVSGCDHQMGVAAYPRAAS